MNKTKKNTRGITLIALVITIIVLLILAGVTIAALSGDNGILTKAKEAKEKTEKENIIEQVNIAIMTATTEGTGTIDTDKLRKELEKNEIKVETEGNSLPWKVVAGNIMLKIDENSAVEEISGKMKISASAKQISSDPERYYGKVAQNYTAGGLTYRIFYVDRENKFGDGANTVYLKADYKITMALTDHIAYEPEGNDLEVYKRMNPNWTVQRGNITPASWNYNERAAGWLCSPTQWTDYLDNTKATYAIGGPSVEMYVASYNDVVHSAGTTKGGLSTEYATKDAPGYIYKVNGELNNSGYSTASNTIDNTGYNNMYAKSKTNWWIASPSSYNSSGVCRVDYSYLDSNYYRDSRGIGPLVSLKSGITVEVEE